MELFVRAFAWLGVIETILCYIGFVWVYYSAGYLSLPLLSTQPHTLLPDAAVHLLASTVYFIGVLAAQIGNAFTCRTEVDRVRELGWSKNRFLLAGVVIQIALIVSLIMWLILPIEPNPVASWSWGLLLMYPLVIFGLDRVRKFLVRHFVRPEEYLQRS
jgi:magnesium-transporting ATPase (P-type)